MSESLMTILIDATGYINSILNCLFRQERTKNGVY